MEIVSLLFWVLLLGIIPAMIAWYKGRSFLLWYVFGIFLFIIALIASIIINKDREKLRLRHNQKECPHCLADIDKRATVCPFCRKDIEPYQSNDSQEIKTVIKQNGPVPVLEFPGDSFRGIGNISNNSDTIARNGLEEIRLTVRDQEYKKTVELPRSKPDKKASKGLTIVIVVVLVFILVTGVVLHNIGESQYSRNKVEQLAETGVVNHFPSKETDTPSKPTQVTQSLYGISMVSIPDGTFKMGDIQDRGENLDEKPVHTVAVSSFIMSAYEITQGQYQAIMGKNPSHFTSGDNYPVENVTWYDAVRFCNKLSDLAGSDRCYNESTWECDFKKNGFRLPTEAEWEYACRAGTETEFYTGNNLSSNGFVSTDIAMAGWYSENSAIGEKVLGDYPHSGELKTHPVGQKTQNRWYLYDMHGNVAEWVNDNYGSYPRGPSSCFGVVRGGCFRYGAAVCRSASRLRELPTYSGKEVGFRVACGVIMRDDLSEQKINQTSTEKIATSGKPTQVTTSLYGISIISVPAGSFQMGGKDHSEEQPIHTVALSSFLMSACEITQYQYKAVMGTNPSYFIGDDNRPVEQVSWWGAIKYCNALSVKAGLQSCYNESTGDCDYRKNGFRLPTEAEWEYSCRASSTTNYNLGDAESDLALAGWYRSNSSLETHPVRQKTPNAWGLYDMHGNVMEWCDDWYGNYATGSVANPTGVPIGSDKINRGGWAFNAATDGCRSAQRGRNDPKIEYYGIGFRVVRRL